MMIVKADLIHACELYLGFGNLASAPANNFRVFVMLVSEQNLQIRFASLGEDVMVSASKSVLECPVVGRT